MLATRRTVVQATCQSQSRIRLYKKARVRQQEIKKLLDNDKVIDVHYEERFDITINDALTSKETDQLLWLLKETYTDDVYNHTTLTQPFESNNRLLVQVSSRDSFTPSFTTNALNIISNNNNKSVKDIKKVRCYDIHTDTPLSDEEKSYIQSLLCDKMTEELYQEGLGFRLETTKAVLDSIYDVQLLEQGKQELVRTNGSLSLGFDEWDIDYYYNLFVNKLGRNPTNVELFDIAQSNSEHSRHWFFVGDLIIDGKQMTDSLMDIVKRPLKALKGNSVIAFKDNSSAIRGFQVNPILPSNPGELSVLRPAPKDYDLLLTAETHNFPTAICPFPGAETGVGGRMRDTHATGKGSIMGAGIAGYCVGNLNMRHHLLPHEIELQQDRHGRFTYPYKLATPLDILIEASNGASDYGNKFGEPLIVGFTRTFGQMLPNKERREWLKPIMFSGGIGQIDHNHITKQPNEKGMLVVKIGGPAYRIGLGGGAASSVAKGDNAISNKNDLDYNAVQRGDAQMAQKLWRVVRACVEMGEDNPIVQIHDQGAGGNCNVIKEIIYPLGAEIDINNIILGDMSLTTLEIWGAEYQENDCILVREQQYDIIKKVCERERCLIQIVGKIDGSGRVKLKPRHTNTSTQDTTRQYALDLDLEDVLGKMPKKQFQLSSQYKWSPEPLKLPSGTNIQNALHRVLQMPSVCSKRFLTTKVDRHVSGLIAQQQCVGPLQIPIADFGLMAQTHQDLSGVATSVGEQPLKGLINPVAMARLALTEAITNICWVVATPNGLEDIKMSVNWMYAAKLKSEGVVMYEAASALADAMIELGCACDGGKDSLSMAVNTDTETVLAPGNLVVSAYVGVPDITKKVTPDLKHPGSSLLIHIDLADERCQRRLGGSAFAQSYNQVGNYCPDVHMQDVKSFYNVIQGLIRNDKILSGHDISDGGIVVTMLEMAFAGNCGITVDIPTPVNVIASRVLAQYATLFAEEAGVVIEVAKKNVPYVIEAFSQAHIPCTVLGVVTQEPLISIKLDNELVVSDTTSNLRDIWETTSFAIEKLQSNPETVQIEQDNLKHRKTPHWNIPYNPQFIPATTNKKVKVAILREEGSNGDREMAAAVYAAGMEPWDVTMSDLINKKADLSDFQGVVFVGGFSYADVFDSAKGWAAIIQFNDSVCAQFKEFYNRTDTFSLGVCNGCQLMSLLGFVPSAMPLDEKQQPRFIHNKSGRFESRWVNVTVLPDHNSIWLQGMENATLGVWIAHGEGQVHFPCDDVKDYVLKHNLAPIRYTDDEGKPTQDYPFNPNGSSMGITALSSQNGRHLAMMPHPERCFMTWQMPYHPKELSATGPSPWLKMFQNARQWAEQQHEQV